MLDIKIRDGFKTDLPELLTIEQFCFSTDRLSERSFRTFIRGEHSSLFVAEYERRLVGYVVVLYRAGTSLARLYSLAILPEMRGHHLATQLMAVAEQEAREQKCVYMRLEVRVDNPAAIALYEKLGYQRVGQIEEYYEDGVDAWKLERPILRGPAYNVANAPYYAQTTDFTCGPAALMMAMTALDPTSPMTRRKELQIWREATTIFMTSGHGGCAPFGLALSAWQRGFNVTVYLTDDGTPFVDTVRDLEKKQIIELVHEDFIDRIKKTKIQLRYTPLKPKQFLKHLNEGHSVISLISTWRFNRNKMPHWVYVAAANEDFVYLHDPDVDSDGPHPTADYMSVPVPAKDFIDMTCFGRRKLKATIVLTGKY